VEEHRLVTETGLSMVFGIHVLSRLMGRTEGRDQEYIIYDVGGGRGQRGKSPDMDAHHSPDRNN
jgi:hypothetical protein